ncbi:MAG: hypothetical protein AB1510_09590, partial [Bacillota bacterium]
MSEERLPLYPYSFKESIGLTNNLANKKKHTYYRPAAIKDSPPFMECQNNCLEQPYFRRGKSIFRANQPGNPVALLLMRKDINLLKKVFR